MERYQRGKVYRIVCRKTGKQYIGSTCKKLLSQRLACHVCDFKKWKENRHHFLTSFEVLKENDYYIELVELVPCSCNDELLVRERFHIENNICENKQLPTRTTKEHYEDNKEELNEKSRKYQQDHKEEIAKKKKEKYDCPCGSTLRKSDKAQHEKSIKHQNYLKKQLENAEILLEKNVVIEK